MCEREIVCLHYPTGRLNMLYPSPGRVCVCLCVQMCALDSEAVCLGMFSWLCKCGWGEARLSHLPSWLCSLSDTSLLGAPARPGSPGAH